MFSIKTSVQSFSFFLGAMVFCSTVSLGAENELMQRYQGLSKEAIDVMPELDQRHEHLVDMYAKLRDAYKQLYKLKRTFGTDARRDAERQAKRMERKIPRAHNDFREELADVLEPYQDRREELKERLFRMESSMDISDMEKFQEQQEKTRKTREEMSVVEYKIRALSEMQKVLDGLEENLPSSAQILGIRDRTEASKVESDDFEDLVEVYYEVRDYEADIERLKKQKKDAGANWDSRGDAILERLAKRLEDAKTEYLKELADLQEPLLDDKEDIEEDIEKTEERLGRASDRRRGKYEEELSELAGRLEEIEENMAVFKRLKSLVATEEKGK